MPMQNRGPPVRRRCNAKYLKLGHLSNGIQFANHRYVVSRDAVNWAQIPVKECKVAEHRFIPANRRCIIDQDS
ncbi:hypothetical protein HAX54_003165 [Datura stramonium]|uniref:Uncharacterized protein n=1 Tax=Datura stramonium TaxID=4076 RepID=A0ABS8T5M5_DATST|nr:hypothetical protein [Datura stramonium]